MIKINRYYEFRIIAQKTPEELLYDLSQYSSENKIQDYIRILKGGEKNEKNTSS
jgi:hypothetical protein